MADKYMLVLDVDKVKELMQDKQISIKQLCALIGWKDPHTLSRYLAHPEKIQLRHVAMIARSLNYNTPYPEELIRRVKVD